MGQVGLGHHHVAHEVGQRHFAGGDEVQRCVVGHGFAVLAALLGGKQVAFELGQLAGALERVGIHGIGHVALGVAVFLRLHVQHELAEGSVQAGNRPLHHGEARARKLHAHVEIQPQRRAHVHVVFHLEGKGAGVCPSGALPRCQLRRCPRARIRAAGWARPPASPAARPGSVPGGAADCSSSTLPAATWALTASAPSLSPLPMSMPTCLDSWLRWACSSSVRVCSVLRSDSRAWKAETSRKAWGFLRVSQPRDGGCRGLCGGEECQAWGGF